MTNSIDHTRHHPGLEMVQCYDVTFKYRDAELNRMIDDLKMTNIQIKIMSDLTNKLANAKQKDKKFDISRATEDDPKKRTAHEDARKLAYLVYLRNPTVFEGKIHNLPVEELDLELKLKTIATQMREEGIPDLEINLGSILERITCDSNIRFDVLKESDIDVVVQGLDSELKMLNADLNERLMNINNRYEDRSLMTENARQVLKEADELNKSIIQKTARGG